MHTKSYDALIADYWGSLRTRWQVGRQLTDSMGVQWWHVAVSVGLSIVVSLLDAVGLSLLAPLAQGLASGDYAGVLDTVPLSGFIRPLFSADTTSVIQAFVVLSVVILAANLLALAVGTTNHVFGRWLQGRYQQRLHAAVYDRYFTFGKGYFDLTSQGHLKKLLEYTANIVALVKSGQNTLTNLARLLAYTAVMVWLSPTLLLFVIVFFPIMYGLTRLLMWRVNRWWDEAKRITLELGRESFNMLSSLPLVWSYGQEEMAQARYRELTESFRSNQFKAQALGDIAIALPRLVTLIVLAAVIGLMYIVAQESSPAEIATFVIFLYVASRTIPLVKVWNEFWVALSEVTPQAREIVRLFRDKDKHVVTGGPKRYQGLTHDISVRNLTLVLNDQVLLDRISCRIPHGTTVALVGPSGAGKSTLLRLFMRFYDCPPGTIYLDGTDIRDFEVPSIRRHFALIDQEPIILNDTLRANILFGHSATVPAEQLNSIIAQTELEALERRLPKGLDTHVGDRGETLSGGEKQRIAIARALLKDASVWLLDEPTSALDALTEEALQRTLAVLLHDRTVITVAHRLATIQHVDNILYLDQGRVQEQGTFQQLVGAQGLFYQQWQAQSF